MKHLHGRRAIGVHASPPTRGAWIETFCATGATALPVSPPTRGAWIETRTPQRALVAALVAPHAGGVD